jgi:uncharacterized protein YbjT (DUF2867 family)
MSTIWLVGGTGLVGSGVEHGLRGRALVSFVRRDGAAAPRRRIDFDALPAALAGAGHCDIAICCLGTTLRTAGSKAAMRRVDHDYVVAFAQAAKAAGARQFMLVSSTMADARASNFYLRLKGETEADVIAVGFGRVDIIRPGLLLGERREYRPGERIAAVLAPVLRPVLVGGFYRYRAISARTVADAIVSLAGVGGEGVIIHENRELERHARQ